jgi:pSer/pThr/pTyr-binding forkhead associated (FHA) protein
MDDTNSTPVENNENSGTEISIPENYVLIFKGARAIPLNQLITSIGRSHDNTVVIDDPRISRHHLEIRFIRDHFVVFDLDSTGGTFINGQLVNQGLLYPGDLISLAGVDLVFMKNRLLPESGGTDTSPIGPGVHPTADFHPSMTDEDINKKYP